MAKKKKINFNDYTDLELVNIRSEKKQHLQEIVFNAKLTPIESPHTIRALKKDIARINTVLSMRRINQVPSNIR